MRWFFVLLMSATLSHAKGEKAGAFDYYVLSLSWSPSWCAIEGDARNSPQCDADKDFGWVLHGLWPQNERGWPSYCQTPHRHPSRAQTAAMADIMGTPGLAWHQWKKHGTCSGLSSKDYFRLSRLAYDAVTRPAVFRKLSKPIRLPARVVEAAFLKSNADWQADQITITCKQNRIQEARICLTRDMQIRDCGADVIRDCSADNALFAPIR